MSGAGDAARWIAGVLADEDVPYMVVGGLAARAHGAPRPLVDIDLYVPRDALDVIARVAGDHVTRAPARHVGEQWDLVYMALEYAGQRIELGAAEGVRIRRSTEDPWTPKDVDLGSAVPMETGLGVVMPVMPRADLVAYKRLLDRDVDREDVAAISGTETVHPEGLAIAPLVREDLDVVARVWSRADAALWGRPLPEVASEAAVDELRRRLDDERGWGLVARAGREVVGVVRLTDARSDRGAGPSIPGLAHLGSLGVEPTRWGAGIGTALVAASEVSALARGYEAVQLVVHDTNLRARSLYHRMGWIETDDRLVIDGAHLTRLVRRLT